MLECWEEGRKTAELRSEEVEPAEAESDESEEDVWSKGSERQPANIEAGSAESEDEDEEPHASPQCARMPAPAAAPMGRATQPLSLTPAATSKGRAASPAPRSTADVSGGRATPA